MTTVCSQFGRRARQRCPLSVRSNSWLLLESVVADNANRALFHAIEWVNQASGDLHLEVVTENPPNAEFQIADSPIQHACQFNPRNGHPDVRSAELCHGYPDQSALGI